MSFILSSGVSFGEDLRRRESPDNRQLPPKGGLRWNYYKEFHPTLPYLTNFEIPTAKKDLRDPKICIIGAGMSGLFAARLLKMAKINNIMILESENRVGGRVYTHYFDKDSQKKLYAELGAMRLPYAEKNNEPFGEHALVFDLINHLNDNNSDLEKKIKLREYIFSDDNGLFFYNNQKQTMSFARDKENFHQLGFPDTVRPSAMWMFYDALQPFFEKLDNNFNEGIKYLKEYDRYSVYSYLKEVYLPNRPTDMKNPPPDDEEIIGAMEMTESATGLFRLAFVEAVMDAYTFSDVKTTWKTIDGGMQKLPDAFCPLLENEINYNCNVYKLEYHNNGIKVYWESQGRPDYGVFDRVIVTAPLGVVRQWELPNFSYGKRRAIRELNYDNSTKIFLQFKSRFWEKDCNIKGGSSSTDLMIRTVVYPSYYDNSPDNPAILLASYTWANDAARFASLTQEKCFRYALRDLEILHDKKLGNKWNSADDKNKSICWTNEKSAAGAFALFGAGQLVNLMPDMIKVENGIHWAGEHTDIHHAWVVGALNSAVRVVMEVLMSESREDDWNELKANPLLRNWHGNL